MNDLLPVVLVFALAAGVWFLAKPPAVFVVCIKHGKPKAVRGTVTPAFLMAVEELCGEFAVRHGAVRGVARGRRISLWFSRGLPLGFCQRLRNWWAMSGWSARPGRAS